MWGDPNAQPQREDYDRINAEDIENHVVIIRPIEYIDRMRVKDEEKDAIKLNIVDLSNDGTIYRNTLWFNRLIGTFKHQLGTPFFGYVTKEKLPNGYRGWSFISLAGNPDWEPVAQQWAAANPEFFTEPLPEKRESSTAHHENGPAPDWAGPVAPPAPPAPRPAAPAPPAPRMAPPAPAPVSAAPASGPPAPPVNGAGMLERLKRQAAQPAPFAGNVGQGEQEPPY